MTKKEAKEALISGDIVAHSNYTGNEFLIWVNGFIYDEHHYNCGTFDDDFWNKYQPWEDGWYKR